MNYRKIFLIILFLLTIVGIGLLFYFVFFRTPEVVVVPPEKITKPPILTRLPTDQGAKVGEPSEIPTDQGAKVGEPSEIPTDQQTSTSTLILDTDISNIITDKNNRNLLYHNKSDSKFYRLNNKGETILLSNKEFHDVQTVNWSPNREKAVLEYPDKSKIVYDFKLEQQITLPKHWQEFSFSPDSSKLAFKGIGLDKENQWLAISSSDGSNAQTIEHLSDNIESVNINWSPNQQIIGTFTQGKDFDRQDLFFIGLHGENFKSTTLPGRGLRAQWTPTGDRLLYSVHRSDTGNIPELWIVDATPDSIGQNRHMLNTNTWVDKCSFKDNNNLICAVPQKLEEGSGYVPDIANSVADDIYQINLNTGTKTLVTTFNQPHTVKNIFIMQGSNDLYFTDKNNGRLYKVPLNN